MEDLIIRVAALEKFNIETNEVMLIRKETIKEFYNRIKELSQQLNDLTTVSTDRYEELEQKIEDFIDNRCTRYSDNVHIADLTDSSNKLWERYNRIEAVLRRHIGGQGGSPELREQLEQLGKEKEPPIQEWACFKCNLQGKPATPICMGLCADHYVELNQKEEKLIEEFRNILTIIRKECFKIGIDETLIIPILDKIDKDLKGRLK